MVVDGTWSTVPQHIMGQAEIGTIMANLNSTRVLWREFDPLIKTFDTGIEIMSVLSAYS